MIVILRFSFEIFQFCAKRHHCLWKNGVFYSVPILTITITVFELMFLLLLPVFYLSGHKIYWFLFPFLMIRESQFCSFNSGADLESFPQYFEPPIQCFINLENVCELKLFFELNFFVVQRIHERPINRLLLIDFGDGSSQSRVFHSYDRGGSRIWC